MADRVVVIPEQVWLDGLEELSNTWHHAGFTAAREFGNPETVELAPSIDAAHLAHQREWSGATFGPGRRTQGVLDHIRSELDEIEADPTDLAEWVDVVILAFDGAWRAGWEPQQIIDAVKAKQAKNEGRTWPDWRTMSPDHRIEHDRTADQIPDPSQFLPFVLEQHGPAMFGVLEVAGRWHSFSIVPEPLAPTGRAGRYDPDNGFATRAEAHVDMGAVVTEYNRIRFGGTA